MLTRAKIKKFLQIDWQRLLRPLPLLVFAGGLTITFWVSHIVQGREQEDLYRQSQQRANDIVDRTVLLVFNSILRIQSYDELFELNGSRIRAQVPTLKRALRRTVFKRLSIFAVIKGKSATDNLPVLKRTHFIEAAESILPYSPQPIMVAEAPRRGIAKLLKGAARYQMVVYERQNVVILSLLWRASSNKNTYYVFSTPLIELFKGVSLNPGEKLIVTDPSAGAKWGVKSVDGKFIASQEEHSEDTLSPIENVAPILDPAEASNKLDIQFVTSEPHSIFRLYILAFLGGITTTFLMSYLFWILLSQNRRISKLVVEKTYDLENANHDLNEALAARSRFLANVSHEIRTPLNLILGMIELCTESSTDDKQRNYLKSMDTAGNHLLGMVEDILDMSRPEFHSVDIQYKEIPLLQFLEEIARIMAPICAEKNLKFYMVLAPDLPMRIYSDPSRLRQILLNLLRNSTKYTREGFILLRVSRMFRNPTAQDALRFEVEDSGVGIPKDRLSQIFDAFFQIQSSKILSGGGVGLGLSIVKDLVKKLNGRIEASSIEGSGSTFRVDMVFEPLQGGPWFQAFEDVSAQKKKVYIISPNNFFIETLSFLDCYEGIDIEVIDRKALAFAKFNAGAAKMYVILDASIPPTKEIEESLKKLTPERIIFVGDRRASVRPLGNVNVVKIDDDPVFPTQVLGSLGLSPKIALRPKGESPENTPVPVFAPIDKDKRLSVIVADDDAGNRELFGAYLESISAEVRFAADGQEAFDLYKQSPPDVMIADLRMPIIDGFTLIEKIREQESTQGLTPIRILLITADALEETAEKAKASKADFYLTKPLRKAQLLEALKA